MTFKQDITVRPTLLRPNQRQWTAGKTLDGGVWLEIEGQGRVVMSPLQAMEMIKGLATCVGFRLEKIPGAEELGN